MLLELGPTTAGDVRDWSRFARRLLCEIRLEPERFPGIASPDLLSAWSDVADTLDSHCASSEDMFRWSGDIDCELGGYLLHGLLQFIESEPLRERVTPEESAKHRAFTGQLIQAFVDGLSAEGSCHRQLADQVRAKLGHFLDH